MAGVPTMPERGENPSEMAGTLMHAMASIVQRVQQTRPTPAELIGLQTMGQAIGTYIQILAQDKEATNEAREMEKDLKLLLDQVQQMGEALAKQAQQAQQGGNGFDPKDMVKAQAMAQQAKIKQDAMMKSHASRTAQKQVSFELKQRQDMDKHRMDMMKEGQKLQMQAASDQLKLENEAKRGSVKQIQSLQE